MKQKEPDWFQLARQNRKPLFSWNKLPGKDSDKLRKFLRSGFVADLAEAANVEKIDTRTINISYNKHNISLKLNKGKTKVTLKIGNGRPYELIAKEKDGKPGINVYDRCVFFIRHTKKATNIPEQIIKKRRNRKRLLIAIDFGNKKITKSIYRGATPSHKGALNILAECCNNGAIVCAEYCYDEKTKMFIGKIEPQTIRKCNILGKTIYNTLQLNKKREITATCHPKTYALLTVIRPSQRGTIARYRQPSSKKIVEAIFKRESLPREAGSLTPAQLEVLCYEWLRKCGKLDALLLPIGRNMEAVDIHGIAKNDKNIFAQVTHSKDAKKIGKKVEKLKNRKGKNSVLFFFGPENQLEKYRGNKKYKGINFKFSTEKVFKKLDEDKYSIYPKMIKAMLPRDYLKTRAS